MTRERQPYWWPSGLLLLLGILVCMIILIVQMSGLNSDLLKFGNSSPNSNSTTAIASPTTKTWTKNATDYCRYVTWLNNPTQYGQVTVFGATILANSAPSPQAHAASIQLYKDLSASKPTGSDIKAINNAYTCPTTSNQQ